jgi:23S rRNA pseudouridine1911/1915/1917 synthase
MDISEHRSFTAREDDNRQRLDRFLHLRAPETSRTRFKDLIKQGFVTCGGRTITEPNYRVNSGDVIEIALPAPQPAEPLPERMDLNIVYEDDQLIVIDKPAGLVTHPGAGHWTGTLVNGLIAHCGDSLSGIGGVKRPGIVHRLDKDTSGLLVVAKTDAAHQALSAQFAAHGRDGKLIRAYRGLIWGAPERRSGTIDTQIDRKTANRTKMAVVRDGGRRAITHYKVLETRGRRAAPVFSLVECRLETGRTHQIRVHMAHIGHPVLCDPAYGAGFSASRARLSPAGAVALDRLNRQALHAAILGFEHPETGETVRFESELPSSFNALLDAERNGG